MVRLKFIVAAAGVVLLLLPLLSLSSTWGAQPWDEPVTCPRCQSDKIVYIIYGEPKLDADLKLALDRGRVALGGCLLTPESHRWECRVCGSSWGSVGHKSGSFLPGGPK